MLETLATGKLVTPFLRFGDRVRIEMSAPDGTSICGFTEQRVGQRGVARPQA
jgi:fumarylacetoacetate (FAA) hydrolase